MTTIAVSELTPDQVSWCGAMDFDQRPNGLSPRRLPAWTRPQIPEMLEIMLRMPSGVRLQFETDSDSVGITALCTNNRMLGAEKRPVVFDLEISDQTYSQATVEGNTIEIDPATQAFEVKRGSPATLTFANLPGGKKFCELWLPHNAYVELQALHLDDGASLTAPATDDRVRWIHYGSSISHCTEAIQPSLIWPAVAAREAGVSLQNLGFGGQCHLDPFVARTIRDSDADIISIKTGINIVNMDSMRERIFSPLLHGFLDTIREGKPNTPIVLISPIFCPCAEDHPGPTIPNAEGKFDVIKGSPDLRGGSMSLSRIRELITAVVETRNQRDRNLYYLNGLELFGSADAADLPDDLHPNPAGYVRMGERFAEKQLRGML
jgi:hypothetical protein